MKRKLIAGLLCCMIVFSIVACGNPTQRETANIPGNETLSGEVEHDTNGSTPTPESNQQTNTESTDVANTERNVADNKDTTSSAEQNTSMVVPIYFEGDNDEILRQKSSLTKNSYYRQITSDYLEHVCEITDIHNYDYLFQTDQKYYTAEDFADCSKDLLLVAKNEIYARHGRMFENEDLYLHFLSKMWYVPRHYDGFDEQILNDCERANLKTLVDLGA